MAEFNSIQKALRLQTPPAKIPAVDNGNVKVAVGTFPATWSGVVNDTIGLGIFLPKGARILRTSRLTCGAFGTSATLDIGVRKLDGTVIDADGLAITINVASAANRDVNGGALFSTPAGPVMTDDVEVFATLKGANPTANTACEVEIYYMAPSP